MNRRGFLFGVGSLLAAPAIVRAGSLMPVSVAKPGFVDVPDLPMWTIVDDTLQDVDSCWMRSELPPQLSGFMFGDVRIDAARLTVDAEAGVITFKMTEKERLGLGFRRSPEYLLASGKTGAKAYYEDGWYGGHVWSPPSEPAERWRHIHHDRLINEHRSGGLPGDIDLVVSQEHHAKQTYFPKRRPY